MTRKMVFGFMVLAAAAAMPALHAETIDFEVVPTATIVDVVFGDGGTGPIAVSGFNPQLALPGNAAVIFDSANPPVTPVETIDDDLGTPNEDFGGPGRGAGGEAGSPFQNDTPLGHLLIINEAAEFVDRDSSGTIDMADSPVILTDDADLIGASLSLDFTAVAPVTVSSIDIIDVELNEPMATVALFGSGGGLRAMFPLPQPGDNGVAHFEFGPIGNVWSMVVSLNGSGAIDNVVFDGEQPFCGDGNIDPGEDCDDGNNIDGDGCDANCMREPGEGCTPGYWKQDQHFDSWIGFTPGTSFAAVFGIAEEGSLTFIQALNRNGDPSISLAKFGVAALLSEAALTGFGLTDDQVIDIVQEGYATGNFEDAKDALEAQVGDLTICSLD